MISLKELLPICEKKLYGNESPILFGYRGSITYGTNIQDSDIDLFLISVKDTNEYLKIPLGYNKTFYNNYKDVNNNLDVVQFDVSRAMHLLVKGNFNMIEHLFTDEQHKLVLHPAGQLLVDNKEEFICKHLFIAIQRYCDNSFHVLRKGRAKQLAHAYRLLAMMEDFIEEGTLRINRSNRDADNILYLKYADYEPIPVSLEFEERLKFVSSKLKNLDIPQYCNMKKLNALHARILKGEY